MSKNQAKKPISRFLIFAVVLILLMSLLIYQLFTLTITRGETYSQEAQSESTDKIITKGKRGSILDCNGLVLAYDETSYNVEFLRDGNNRTQYYSAVYTEALIKAINIIEAGGGTIIDTSYIRMSDNGELYYDWGVTNETSIKARYKNFCNVCGFSFPDENDMSTWISAENAYLKLRSNWFIPEELPFEDAVKIISIRQEVLLNDYRAYEPIIIAYDVSMDVVAQIEMMKDELPGLQTSQSTKRIYPYGETAAHVIGYCQKMRAEDADELLKLGYGYDDYIGVSGIEATMEEYLTACTTEHHGSIVLETNANGSIVNIVSKTPATDGSDVTLTLDLQMQIVTENALRDIITAIHEKQEQLIADDPEGEYGEYENIEMAKTGAIVVMDVNTGEVRAMASYPSFDPNWFISGLTPEQTEYLFTSEAAAATTPTRNKAISMKLAPGSIFKMATGLAGLMEGAVGLDETIDDESPYYLHDEVTGEVIKANPASCWTSYPAAHSNQTIIEALKNSCNYYFCEVAYRLGIDKLVDWAGKLGLADKTNIELTGETKGIIGGQSALYDNSKPYDEQSTSLPILVYRQLCSMLTGYQNTRGVEVDSEAVSTCAKRLMELQDGSLTGKGSSVRQILSEELGIPDGISRAQTWVGDITSMLNELQWKSSYTIRTGFGQSICLVSPIAAARYVSSIANGGTVYDAHIVNRVTSAEGALLHETEPTVFNEIDAPDEYWTAIRSGMAGVVSPEDRGTASDAFSEEFNEAGYLSKISGKTGSAQVGNITIDIQNTSWFVVFAPNDDPDIAIVVCIPNGLSGSSSAGAIEDILTYYFKKIDAASPESLVGINNVTP